MNVLKVVAAMAMLAVSAVEAASPVVITGIDTYGSGCRGDAKAKVVDDGKSFYVDFVSFRVDSKKGDGVRTESCNISMNVDMPKNYQVAIANVEFSGIAGIAKGGEVDLDIDYFFNNEFIKNEGSTWYGKKNGRTVKKINFKEPVYDRDLVWSSCGISSQIIIEVNATSVSGDGGKNTSVAMNYVDSFVGLKYRKCG